MVTKITTSNVTKLRTTRNVKEDITSKTAGQYKPRQHEFYIRDKKLAGFWIRVSPYGRKTYGCYGRLFGVGKEARVSIGNTDNITASQARKQATKHLQDIKAGTHPKKVAKEAAAKTSTTIESLIEQYLETKEKSLKSRTIYDYKYRLRTNFSALIKKDVNELTIDDLREWWLTKQGKKDPIHSKQVVLRYLSAILTYAKVFKLVEDNVAKDFKKIIDDPKASRPASPNKRHIKKADMESWRASFLKQSVPHAKYKLEGSWSTTAAANYPALWNSNPTISETQRDFLLFLLLTGKRLNESARLTWKDLDWNNEVETLTLQPETTKADRPDVVPMTQVIGAMLKYRKNFRPEKHNKWVFENKYGSGPIVSCRKSLEKICHYEEENFEIDLPETINHHDLRRTYATMAEELGISKTEIGTLLSHTTGDVTESYITKSLERNREKRVLIENEILQEDRWYILVNWYECNQDLIEHWDQGPQDERPKAGYLDRLYLPREEHDKYRWK